MRYILPLMGLSLLAMTPYQPVRAEEVPLNFLYHKDTLIHAMQTTWPEIAIPSAIAGLVEQETCPRLDHPKCWSRYAELKTKHEHGIGLGQFTITKRFNAFEEVKALDPRLKNWKEGQYHDARLQLIAIVVKLKYNHRAFSMSKQPEDRMAFALAAYNGGLGGIMKDQRICKNTSDCDHTLWFGNTERTSLKTKKPFNGFSRSAFDINREYPVNILRKRRHKYKPHIDEYFEGTKL